MAQETAIKGRSTSAGGVYRRAVPPRPRPDGIRGLRWREAVAAVRKAIPGLSAPRTERAAARLLAVSAYLAGWPARSRQVAFMRRFAPRLRAHGMKAKSARTLRLWLSNYRRGGAIELVDYRGGCGAHRILIERGLWRRLVAGIAAGRSVAGLHRVLGAVADKAGQRWPALRTLQGHLQPLRELRRRNLDILRRTG